VAAVAGRGTELAVLTARAFLEEFGLDCGSRLEEVAAQLRLRIIEAAASGFEGALLRIAGRPLGTIVLRRDIPEPGRRRFTLAHEIGHYVLPNQQETLGPCRPAAIESWDGSLNPAELDANRFAAEILVPHALVTAELQQPPTLDIVRKLAERFGTSLTAAAVRLVELTSYRAALVCSRNGSAEWYRASEEFGRAVRLGPLDQRTLAYDCFRNGDGARTDRVLAEAWLYDSNLLAGALIWEHSLLLRSYGLVLSLLEIRERVEVRTEDDEEEDSGLDPEEFTLRRKHWPRR
jgi:hypothetical protein